MKTLIVIPARLESTRLHHKLLLAETGMPLIWHVWNQVRKAGGDPFVATDSDEIYQAVVDFNGLVISTGEHLNGTSRAAEVVGAFPQAEVFCIVQADEPEIDPRLIDEVVQQLEQRPEWDCATAACDIADEVEFRSRNCVKATLTSTHEAFDFRRDWFRGVLSPSHIKIDDPAARLHIGIYAYRRDALLRYAAAGPCQREVDESLEQLRALHIGLKMGVVLTDHQSHGIDTREDYEDFRDRWFLIHGNPNAPVPRGVIYAPGVRRPRRVKRPRN